MAILKAREPACILTANGSKDDENPSPEFKQRWVNQCNFYLNDRHWGRMFVRICPYLLSLFRAYLFESTSLAGRAHAPGGHGLPTVHQCLPGLPQCRTSARVGRFAGHARPAHLPAPRRCRRNGTTLTRRQSNHRPTEEITIIFGRRVTKEDKGKPVCGAGAGLRAARPVECPSAAIDIHPERGTRRLPGATLCAQRRQAAGIVRQNGYVRSGNFGERRLAHFIEEFVRVRRATVRLVRELSA